MNYGRAIEWKQGRITIRISFGSTTNSTANSTSYSKITATSMDMVVLSKTMCYKVWLKWQTDQILNNRCTHKYSSRCNNKWCQPINPPPPCSKGFWIVCLAVLLSTIWPSKNILNTKYTSSFTLNCIKIYNLINIIIDIFLILRINS